MAVNAFRKFCLLMWKNWLLEKRHWIVLFFEFSLPLIFCSIPLLFRILIEPRPYDKPTYFNSFLPYSKSSYIPYNITFAPNKGAISKLVETALGPNVPGFRTTQAMLEYLTDREDTVGIVFTDDFPTDGTYPVDLKFSLRFPSNLHYCSGTWQTDQLFPDTESNKPRSTMDWEEPPCYRTEGFLALQAAVSEAFINLTSNGQSVPLMQMQRFPYPPYMQDTFIEVVRYFMHIMLIISFVSPFGVLVKQITAEKEHQLKEVMKMMGLDNWLHWLAWIIKSMIFLTIISVVIIVLFKIPVRAGDRTKVFEYSDPYVLFLIMVLYSFSTTCFAMMSAVFFSKANTAQSISSVAFFIGFIPYNILDANYATTLFGQKASICLLSNSALSLIVKFIFKLEDTGVGLQWDNLFEPVMIDDDFSIGLAMVMLIIDSVIYTLIGLYVERIYPGEYGIPDPWYFPFTKSFWCGDQGSQDSHALDGDKVQSTQNFEPGPDDKRPGIEIRSLRKVYGRSKVAVSGLTMDMYEDQITALLGHNGAGKTTTMSMLTGLFPPSSGTAFINGYDIRKNIRGVRASLGLCPQKNVVFNDLTVEEHLQFYCSLKGLNNKRTKEEIAKYLGLLDLLTKRKSLSSKLSGGMKRKLCVAIALCGDSKVVLLDEPTSGMDPAARRNLWNLLQQDKRGRTILLSTHFMDEADILGDRIAILSHGDLKACGSSFYLKKHFGVGYHLICEKGARCNAYNVTKLLQNYVPDIKAESNVGSELSFNIPEEVVPIFGTLLKDLEKNSANLDIAGYGISPTTLEEVFLRVEKASIDEIKNNGDQRQVERDAEALELREYQVDSSILLKGVGLQRAQWNAMFAKKFYYTIRNWFLLLIHVAIPILMLTLTVLSIKSSGTVVQLPPLKITLDSYHTTTSILQHGNNPTLLPYETEYEKMFSGSNKLVKTNEDFQDYILNLGKSIQPEINRRYMVAMSSNGGNITAWFNNQALHSSPLTLNLVYNALIRALSGRRYTIEVTNEPLPFSKDYVKRKMEQSASLGFIVSFSVGISMCYVSAFFVLFTIKERISRAKLLQFVSGINIFTFWSTSFLWDFIVFLGIISLVTTTFAILQSDGYSTSEQIGRIFIVLVLFAFASIPLSYLLSLMFDVPASGYGKISAIYLLIGPVAFIIVFGLGMSLEPEKTETITWFFRILPHFCMSFALNNLYMKGILCDGSKGQSPADCSFSDYFALKNSGIGGDILFLVVDGLLYMMIILLTDYGVFNELFFKIVRKFSRRPPGVTYGPIDDDVLAEKELVATMSKTEIQSKNLVLKDVTKYYKSFLAVNKLSVAIQKSECFGLLGVNGAGKTSTFKMLTGDESISSGDIIVQGIDFKKHMSAVYKHIGYCPQFDALLEDLSGRETIKIFCLLRGVPHRKISSITTELAQNLGFHEHLDKRIKEYSGGTKRKLSAALALIGGPDVIYLDEPTTGMDPKSRRQLWDVICKVRDSGKTIVLTSHSMEECEALCTRLAIMVNGEFICLGSRQHLKNKFSKGLQLIVKVKKIDDSEYESSPQTSQYVAENQLVQQTTVAVEKVKAFVFSVFEGAILKDEYKELLTFFVPQTSIKWSEIFGLLQYKKDVLHIEDYSVSQTSLEQIFLEFAKNQLQKT